MRRLQWKFRASKRLDLLRGHIYIRWEIYCWLFFLDAVAVFVLHYI